MRIEPPLPFEEVPCAVCGSMATTKLFENPDLLTEMPGKFNLVRCEQCGVLRQHPRLAWSALKHYYPDEDYIAYRPSAEKTNSGWRRWLAQVGLRRRVRAIQKFQDGGRLLDVGCGTGHFLSAAQENGRFSLMGLEPNDYAADYVRQSLNIPVVTGTFPEQAPEGEQFDIITMWNVLEHLPEPVASLEAAHQLLKPGGWLIFSLPNVDGWEANWAGRHWIGWDLPRHLYLYPRTTLQDMLAKTGFVLQEFRCLSTSYHALGWTLRLMAESEAYVDKRPFQVATKLYHTPIVRAATMPIFWFLDQQRLSSIVTYFCQRTD